MPSKKIPKPRVEFATFPLQVALDLFTRSKRKLVAESGITIHFLRLMHKALNSLPAVTESTGGRETAEGPSGAHGSLTQEMVTDIWRKVLIAQARPKREWKPEHLALLGTMSDAHAVEIIGNGIHRSAVLAKRRELKIPDFTDGRKSPAPRSIDPRWTEEALSLLGKLSDMSVAEQTGIPQWTVQRMRNRLGIISTNPPRAPWVWTKEQLALLGTMTDADVAAKIGNRIAVYTVMKKRKELGIQSNNPHPNATKFQELWTPDAEALLGSMADGAVAKKIGNGLTWSAARNKRISKGIEPFSRSATV